MISISPATVEDAHALAEINTDAFRTDPIFQIVFGLAVDAPPEQRQADLKFRQGRLERNLENPQTQSFKAVDETSGSTVGYAFWAEPERRHGVEKKLEAREKPIPPSHVKQEVFERLETSIQEAFREQLGERKDVWCMGVHPSHQRQGIAQQMMTHGLALIDEKGEDCYLGASPAGKTLYQRNGFEVLSEAEVLEGCIMTVMLRRSPRVGHTAE